MFHLFWVLIVGMLGVNIEYIVPMFQENRKYTGACVEKVNSVLIVISIRRKVAKGRS